MKKKSRDKNRVVVVSWSNCCLFYVGKSPRRNNFGRCCWGVPRVPASSRSASGAVCKIDIPLGLYLEESVESPPSPAVSPSPALSDDGEFFMKIYDRAEILLLKDWMEHTRILRGGVGYFVLSPLISERLKSFLGVLYGPQWEAKFLRGDPMLQAYLGAYVSCYYGLTGFQRVQWDRLFPAGPRWSSGLSWRRWLSPAASSRWSRP